MAYSPLSHLTRRGDVFYFRRAIPVQLTAKLDRKEWKFSLRTSDRVVARLRCRECSNAFDQFMDVVSQMSTVDAKEINLLLRNFFETLLSEGEDIIFRIRDDASLNNTEETEEAERLKGEYQKEIASNTFSGLTKSNAIDLLVSVGRSKKDIGHEDFDDLCRGILRAKSEQNRIFSAMLRGAYDEVTPKDQLFDGIVSPGLPSLPGESVPAKGDTASHIIEKYIEIRSSNEWTQKTTNENERLLGWFVDQIGKTRKLKDITADDVRTFRDLISKLPKSFSKRSMYGDLSLQQIADKGKTDEKLSAATQQKYLGIIKAFLGWCEDEHDIDMSAAIRIKGAKKASQYDARHPFSPIQLEAIFQSPQYTGHRSPSRRSSSGNLLIRDGKFWIPLLGLITGARMSELIQLTISDVVQLEDSWCLDINKGDNSDSDKSLKSYASQRKIPLHPELIKIGFLDFVEDTGDANRTRIFEEIKPGENGTWSHNFSKYFGRYLKQINVKTQKTTFHSFRHNFADALRMANIEDSHIKALMGHADGTVTSIYGSGVPLNVLAIDMQKVTFGVSMEHLYT